MYNERVPEEDKLQFTRTVDEEPNPVFNEQLVVEPPASVHERDGFLYVGLQFKDEYQFERAIYIPLSIMSTFVPYHFVPAASPSKSTPAASTTAPAPKPSSSSRFSSKNSSPTTSWTPP